jgi:hypothetical protein
METKDYSSLSNSELKLHIESLTNLFESKKNKIIKLCEELEDIEKEYLKATNEVKIRRDIYL